MSFGGSAACGLAFGMNHERSCFSAIAKPQAARFRSPAEPAVPRRATSCEFHPTPAASWQAPPESSRDRSPRSRTSETSLDLRKELAQPLEAFDHDAIGARRAAATQQLEAVRYDHERIPVVAPGVEQGVLHLSTGTGDELSVAIMPRPVAEERDGKLPHAIDEARLQKQVLRIHAALMAEVAGVVAGVEGDAVACEGASVAKSAP